MFTIIAERINMTRKSINRMVRNRDTEAIATEARRQAEAGATHIDINAGGNPSTEVEDMKWLTETVAGATDLPIAFDSPNPDALRAGLEICNRPGTIINSITCETKRIKEVLPLMTKFNAGVIALTKIGRAHV